MRFGITGGAGFIGSNLSRLLLNEGHEVVILDDFSTGLISNLKGLDVDIIDGSLLDNRQVENFVASSDFIFHLAARGSVPRSLEDPLATFEVNTQGTLNVLEAVRKKRISLVFTSSSSVYGDNMDLPKRENQRISPITPYAASKASAESFVYAYAKSYGLNLVNVRFFNVYGPFQRPDHVYAAVIPKWIWAALNNQELIVHGDGEATRDFTYVDSVTTALHKIALQSDLCTSPLNLAFGHPVSLNSLLTTLKTYFPNLQVRFENQRHGDLRASANDPAQLHAHFPDLTETTFEVGLENTIDWLKTKYNLIHESQG